VCDNEWDCSDASDEEALILNMDWSPHNRQLHGLLERTKKCKEHYVKQAFSNICNISEEFPCFLSNVEYMLNITENRPCIPLRFIGDGYQNCYGGIDEKNTLALRNGQMFGYGVKFEGGESFHYQDVCEGTLPFWRDQTLCFYKSKNSSCSNTNDVVCLDGSCREDSRCNGILECKNGEDEYLCPPQLFVSDQLAYRYSKQHLHQGP